MKSFLSWDDRWWGHVSRATRTVDKEDVVFWDKVGKYRTKKTKKYAKYNIWEEIRIKGWDIKNIEGEKIKFIRPRDCTSIWYLVWRSSNIEVYATITVVWNNKHKRPIYTGVITRGEISKDLRTNTYDNWNRINSIDQAKAELETLQDKYIGKSVLFIKD